MTSMAAVAWGMESNSAKPDIRSRMLSTLIFCAQETAGCEALFHTGSATIFEPLPQIFTAALVSTSFR